MPSHLKNKTTLSILEFEVYGFKRRSDLLVIAAEHKLDGRLTEKWRSFYTHIYNSLNNIDQLPFLISEKKYPESHYNWVGPQRIDPKYFEKGFKQIAVRADSLCKNAHGFNAEVKEDVSLIASIRTGLVWVEWLDMLEEIYYDIHDTKEILVA